MDLDEGSGLGREPALLGLLLAPPPEQAAEMGLLAAGFCALGPGDVELTGEVLDLGVQALLLLSASSEHQCVLPSVSFGAAVWMGGH